MRSGASMSNRLEILEILRTSVQRLEKANHEPGEIVPSGCGGLDTLLEKKGFERGTLVEWLGTAGSGATMLAMLSAQQACVGGGTLAIVDDKRQFYPPAAKALGIDLGRTIVLQPQNIQDTSWCLQQILSCPGIAAVMCWPDTIKERMLRRLQLAAEKGGALAMLMRPPDAQHHPSWAKVRFFVTAQCSQDTTRRWRVMRLGSYAQSGQSVELEIDHETGKLREAGPLPLAAALVPPTPYQIASRA